MRAPGPAEQNRFQGNNAKRASKWEYHRNNKHNECEVDAHRAASRTADNLIYPFYFVYLRFLLALTSLHHLTTRERERKREEEQNREQIWKPRAAGGLTIWNLAFDVSAVWLLLLPLLRLCFAIDKFFVSCAYALLWGQFRMHPNMCPAAFSIFIYFVVCYTFLFLRLFCKQTTQPFRWMEFILSFWSLLFFWFAFVSQQTAETGATTTAAAAASKPKKKKRISH